MSVAMIHEIEVSLQEYKQISGHPNACKKQETLKNELGLEEFISKLEANGMKLVFRKNGEEKELISFVCILTNEWRLAVDVIFEKDTNGVMIQMTVPYEDVGQYFHHALTMIANV